ncbi:hypothetical protein V1514DRAFT_353923 [Lipomyces japonicus]|uniref:uncharacterized protein n=1 Tax=Lipomyces japonicus TaxID=56871 RepID=UPI0034CE6355
MSVVEYNDMFDNLRRQLPEGFAGEQQIICQYCTGLLISVTTEVYRYNPATLAEAKRLAINADTLLKMGRKRFQDEEQTPQPAPRLRNQRRYNGGRRTNYPRQSYTKEAPTSTKAGQANTSCYNCGSFPEHQRHLDEVMGILRERKLYAKKIKCEFYKDTIDYLGHRISARSALEVTSFKGLVGYYGRFIQQFNGIAAPMSELTQKGVKFEWTSERQRSFETLEQKMVNPPFRVTTKLSDVALGAVLEQVDENRQMRIGTSTHPVAFESKKFHHAELRYPVRDLSSWYRKCCRLSRVDLAPLNVDQIEIPKSEYEKDADFGAIYKSLTTEEPTEVATPTLTHYHLRDKFLI